MTEMAKSPKKDFNAKKMSMEQLRHSMKMKAENQRAYSNTVDLQLNDTVSNGTFIPHQSVSQAAGGGPAREVAGKRFLISSDEPESELLTEQ